MTILSICPKNRFWTFGQETFFGQFGHGHLDTLYFFRTFGPVHQWKQPVHQSDRLSVRRLWRDGQKDTDFIHWHLYFVGSRRIYVLFQIGIISWRKYNQILIWRHFADILDRFSPRSCLDGDMTGEIMSDRHSERKHHFDVHKQFT